MIQANSLKELKQKQAERSVSRMDEMIRTRGIAGTVPLSLGAVVIEQVTDLLDVPVVAIVKVRGQYRVLKAVTYVNKAIRLQISIFIKDFDTQDEAETLFLEVLELNGHLAFGDIFRLSKGSGLRYIETVS